MFSGSGMKHFQLTKDSSAKRGTLRFHVPKNSRAQKQPMLQDQRYPWIFLVEWGVNEWIEIQSRVKSRRDSANLSHEVDSTKNQWGIRLVKKDSS